MITKLPVKVPIAITSNGTQINETRFRIQQKVLLIRNHD